jgi:hypothetical protein
MVPQRGRRRFSYRVGVSTAAVAAVVLLSSAGGTALLSGCSGSKNESVPVLQPRPTVFRSVEEETLFDNREKWLRQGMPAYTYRLKVGCFCTPDVTRPVRVTVENGVRTSIRPEVAGATVDEQSLSRYDTVEKVFAIIENAINSNAEVVRVTYDPQRGYPTEVYLDYSRQMADEELFLEITDVSGFLGEP